MPEIKPLRFVTLVGSLRKASFNAAVARALPALAPKGVTIEALSSVKEFPLYDADLHTQGFPPEVIAMGEAIKSSDGVIFVTPEYNYSVPGILKNALDWLSRLPSTPFAGKAVVIQTASPGVIGGARCQYHLRQVLVFLDAYVLNKPKVMIGGVAAKVDVENGIITDAATREFIAKQLEASLCSAKMSSRSGSLGRTKAAVPFKTGPSFWGCCSYLLQPTQIYSALPVGARASI